MSEADSEEENEEGDYTVYECPGLAPVSAIIHTKWTGSWLSLVVDIRITNCSYHICDKAVETFFSQKVIMLKTVNGERDNGDFKNLEITKMYIEFYISYCMQ